LGGYLIGELLQSVADELKSQVFSRVLLKVFVLEDG